MSTNSGEPWSKAGIRDLTMELAIGRTVAEIANYLCRDEAQVREKMKELGLIDHPGKFESVSIIHYAIDKPAGRRGCGCSARRRSWARRATGRRRRKTGYAIYVTGDQGKEVACGFVIWPCSRPAVLPFPA